MRRAGEMRREQFARVIAVDGEKFRACGSSFSYHRGRGEHREFEVTREDALDARFIFCWQPGPA